jgi:DNA transformation protein
MTPSIEFEAYVAEFLKPIVPFKVTRFFGGKGLTYNAVQFGMMIGNNLYFVVNDLTRSKYEQAGMRGFSYLAKKGRIEVRRYFELPEDVLTDTIQLRLWTFEAISIANQTKRMKH